MKCSEEASGLHVTTSEIVAVSKRGVAPKGNTNKPTRRAAGPGGRRLPTKRSRRLAASCSLSKATTTWVTALRAFGVVDIPPDDIALNVVVVGIDRNHAAILHRGASSPG